ncbi:MAG: dihydrodipicolinate synthase family protein [Balneolaceae bacterium]|nr:dihydrodipicolinate synthase family protein [Balneolaceae bacterium]
MTVSWEGIYPAITTPFTEEHDLDLPLFRKSVRAQIDGGVHGLIIGGSLGEASTITNEEKFRLAEAAKKDAPDDFPIIINLAESTTANAVALAEAAGERDMDGLMVLPPMKYKATDREVVAWFDEIAASTDLPILVYNNPVDYGIEVTLDMFGELIEHDNIQAVKESTRDLSNVTRMKNRFGDRIKILCGVDTLALESLLMGADGWVAGLVDAFPRETVAIYELVQRGRRQEAVEIYRWFMPLLELDITPQLVQNIKLAQQAEGIGSEHVRPPRLPLIGKERKRVVGIIEEAIENRPELPDFN